MKTSKKNHFDQFLILKFCKRIPVVPQGGNTGLVGGAVPYPINNKFHSQVIISLNRMNKIISIDKVSGVVKVESGCVLEEIDKRSRDESGCLIPIDLGAKGSCQVGGLLSTNAGGIRFLRLKLNKSLFIFNIQRLDMARYMETF